MLNFTDQAKSLATWAVARELYDSKKDFYGIIAAFITDIISTQKLISFNLTEITQALKDIYEFNIPEEVVKTSLKRLTDKIKKAQGSYSVCDDSLLSDQSEVNKTFNKINQINNNIIENLFNFIESKTNKRLKDTEKENVVRSFCSFIIDESSNNEYSNDISAFLLTTQRDISLSKTLNTIKEGVILYTGLKYSPDISDLGSWKTELTIFVETEILFHLAGYNGILYKSIFNDFYSLVTEINQKSAKTLGKKLINIRYFPEVREEIEYYFRTAEDLLMNNRSPIAGKTAMETILAGSKSASDIIDKQSKFFTMLKQHSIVEDTYPNYYAEKNKPFNIESKNILKKYINTGKEQEYSTSFKYLNYVNIRRNNLHFSRFEDVGYILLTGSKNTFQLSNELGSRIPLATSLNFLTNKFWFKLNKGFGDGEYPKTFGIITKAQIILSSQLNQAVTSTHEKLNKDKKAGKLSEDEIISAIIALRERAIKPEDITLSNIDEVMESINEIDIEHTIREKQLLKEQVKNKDRKIKDLLDEISKLVENNESLIGSMEDLKKQSGEQNYELKRQLNKIKENDEAKKKRKQRLVRWTKHIAATIMAIILISWAANLFFQGYSENQNKFSFWIQIISFFLAGLGFFGVNFTAVRAKIREIKNLFLSFFKKNKYYK
ncbi:MAG: hypothetical protein K9M19_01900 [Candidatus Marinimicrobia bacterium]|nr:hypothetical protein [Candidatus Neomarinimicrobiota bacterium]